MGRWIKTGKNRLEYNPYSLKFYEKEHELFSEAYSKKLTQEETGIVFNKLCRHYKIHRRLLFNRRNTGIHNSWSIQLPYYNIPFGLLIHEIAHAIDIRKRGKSKHDKKFMNIIKRVNNYCKKKNWWKEELKRRTEVKIKPEPTKIEIRQEKLEKRKKDLVRYEKKLSYYTKLYSNKIKKARRSILMLERNLK